MTRQLSASQHVILADAINHSDGKLNRFPDNIKGAAGTRVLDAREARGTLVRVPEPGPLKPARAGGTASRA